MVQADLVQVSSFGNSISDIWKSSFALLLSWGFQNLCVELNTFKTDRQTDRQTNKYWAFMAVYICSEHSLDFSYPVIYYWCFRGRQFHYSLIDFGNPTTVWEVKQLFCLLSGKQICGSLKITISSFIGSFMVQFTTQKKLHHQKQSCSCCFLLAPLA